jgi:ATP adenylyltransferase
MKHLYAPWRSVYLMSEVDAIDGCLFCVLPDENDDRKNMILERGDNWYLIVNKYPYTTGHIMLTCNRHLDRFTDLDEGERADLPPMMSRCERALDEAYHPHGINVGVNLGRSAGAGVEGHLHIHLVPRWDGDTNFMSTVGGTRVVSEDLNDTYERLKKALESLSPEA